MKQRRKVLVVGAGIGGLATALACEQADMDVELYERRENPSETALGAGLHLWSNAITALARLGIDDQVIESGVVVNRHRYLKANGKEIGQIPVASLSVQVGAPTVGVQRRKLHQILVDALTDTVPTYGKEATGFEQDRGGVRLRFTDGTTAEGDVLIGADGLHSKVRRQLHGVQPPEYRGMLGWRALVDFDDSDRATPGDMVIHWGRGVRLVSYYVGENKLYWLALVKSPQDSSTDPELYRSYVVDALNGFDNAAQAVVNATSPDAIIRTEICDHDPLKVLGQHRVTLVGDAAHPMTPDMAQGAGQALEDAVSVARLLAHSDRPDEGLREYESIRLERANGFVEKSRVVNRLGGFTSRPLCAVRDNVVLPIVYRTQAWGPAQKNMTAVV